MAFTGSNSYWYLSKWVRTKHGPGVHGPPLWTGSMDHFHEPPVIDQVDGHFFYLYKKVFTRSMDTQKRFDETLSTNAHD